MSRFNKKVLPAAVITALAATQSGLATAQEETVLEEVVVTGTLIRGAQVTGSQEIGLDSEAITDLGARTTSEMLASVPQVSNYFNQRPEQDPRGADRLQVNRPVLRSMPGIDGASGALTLVLVDSIRLVPMGTDQASLDPDVIPGIVMERVDIVPDGGSSLYGADAVGGVINFVSRDEFEGVKVDLGYDIGDDFDGWQAAFMAGTSWEGGNGYIALSTTDRDSLSNADRDWAATGLWDDAGKVLSPDGTECIEPVGSVTTWVWIPFGINTWTDNPAAPGAGVTPLGEPCDSNAASNIIPQQERDNLFGSITQEIGDNMTFKAKAYYMDRSTTYDEYPRGDSVSAPTPAELGLVGETEFEPYEQQKLGFSYAAHPAYTDPKKTLDIESWGITPELIIDLGNSWQVRNTLYYGESDNTVDQPITNRAKMLAYIEQGALDPSNVAAADAAVIQDILDWTKWDDVQQTLWSFRAIADGDVFELPAGTLRAAVGVQYIDEETEKSTGDVTRGAQGTLETFSADRDVKSAFGELSVPVFQSLTMTFSARYDDYSDFGDTTNPSVGFDWDPVDWLTIYGKWGESFNAPTLLDSVTPGVGTFFANSVGFVADPNGEITDSSGSDVFLLEGTSGALAPQTAEVKALGFELRPIDGLSLEAYYYKIEFADLLGAPNPQSSAAVQLNPQKFVFNPTEEELDAFIAQVINADQFDDISASQIGIIVDRRRENTDEATLEGWDFGVRYTHDISFGMMTYGFTGNYTTTSEFVRGVAPDQSVVDNLSYLPDLFVSADIGWYGQNARASLTFRYTDGYDADPSVAIGQDDVDDFLSTYLFVGYDFAGSSSDLLEGLSLRFNVDNVFDEDPPEYRRNQQLNYSAEGFTLGRVYKLGLSYQF